AVEDDAYADPSCACALPPLRKRGMIVSSRPSFIHAPTSLRLVPCRYERLRVHPHPVVVFRSGCAGSRCVAVRLQSPHIPWRAQSTFLLRMKIFRTPQGLVALRDGAYHALNGVSLDELFSQPDALPYWQHLASSGQAT